MNRLYLAAILSSLLLIGCGEGSNATPAASSVAATDVAKSMIGKWGVDGEVALIVTLQDDRVQISAPANDTWRMDIHNAEIVDDTIHFVQKNYLHNGDAHPFNGVACNSVIKLIDQDKLEFATATVDLPDPASEILTRVE